MATTKANLSAAELSSQIFLYTNRRSNNIIYSLTRTIHNTKALKQLPFLGKKTVPTTIRKDEWSPFATVQFSSPYQCREAFRQLQEFRKRHFLEWPVELKKGKDGRAINKHQLGARLGDQRANSVADLAAVLSHHQKIADKHQDILNARKAEEESHLSRLPQVKAEMLAEKASIGSGPVTQKYKDLKREKLFLKKQIQRTQETAAAGTSNFIHKSKGRKKRESELPAFSTADIEIEWADPQSASWASNWPENITHTAKLRERRLNVGDGLAEMARLDDEAAALQQSLDEAILRLEGLKDEETERTLQLEIEDTPDTRDDRLNAQIKQATDEVDYRRTLLLEARGDQQAMRDAFRQDVFSVKSYSARLETAEEDVEEAVALGATESERPPPSSATL